MSNRRVSASKAYVVFLGFCLLSIAIVVKGLSIQLVEGAKWQRKVERFTTQLRDIEPTRGNIYASNGTVLAASVPTYNVYMDMRASKLTRQSFYEHLGPLSAALSAQFGDKPAQAYAKDLSEAFEKGKRYHLVKRDLDYDQMAAIKTFPLWNNPSKLRSGLIIDRKVARKIPNRELAARTLGYSKDGTYNVGLEGAYNDYLAGRPGKRYEKLLAGGGWMPVSSDNLSDPIDGCDLYTTIDAGIQDVARAALQRTMTHYGGTHGCTVVMETKTGRVRAIANLTRGENGTYTEVLNHAISASTEPGSVFKLASFMAAFEDGLLDMTDTADTKGGSYKFFDRKMYESEKRGSGMLTTLQAFQKSSNVATSRLIYDRYKSNQRAFTDRLLRMGLGRPLGIELAGEGVPRIKDPADKDWWGTTLPWMSIGYETMMTPLQVLTFYNAVANDGSMVKPQFVEEIRRNGKLVKRFKPEVIHNQIASRETIKKARILCESVVSPDGTAHNLVSPAYTIGGKTGTSLMANDAHGYSSDQVRRYQASFVGYFPADDPEYSIITVVYGLTGVVYYGAHVAGPVFREIADRIYSQRFDLHKEVTHDLTQVAVRVPVSKGGRAQEIKGVLGALDVPVNDQSNGAEWVATRAQTDEVLIEPRVPTEGKVPNVIGMGLRDGLHLLENAGLHVRVSGTGVIVRQSIAPGSNIAHTKTILIELS
jgi:cell division protein FtsI (penicillin-binding protein 3)